MLRLAGIKVAEATGGEWSFRPQFLMHPRTKLFIVIGRRFELEIADQILKELKSGPGLLEEQKKLPPSPASGTDPSRIGNKR